VKSPAAGPGGRVMQDSWQHDSAVGGSESAMSGRTNIPTDLLRTFVAICELGSFTKTANLLDLTQPAVSAHMRRLESMIGADLIAKSLTGVVLTECGTEVLRHARRMLAINDQIVNGSSVEAEPQVVRVGIPNISAPNVLAGIAREGAAVGGQYRLQVCCDHSHGLLRSVRAGYLELVAVQFVDETEPANTVVRWAEDLVWVKAPDFVFNPDVPVPLVSSPNLLLPDRLGMAALEAANRPYEIVFTAFDTLARRAAAEAGLGYFAIPRSAVAETLVIEAPGLLPDLPQVNMGIVARDDLDTAALAPLIARIERLFTAKV
jgi:DNA-binding transcriptional LysR family regulator